MERSVPVPQPSPHSFSQQLIPNNTSMIVPIMDLMPHLLTCQHCPVPLFYKTHPSQFQLQRTLGRWARSVMNQIGAPNLGPDRITRFIWTLNLCLDGTQLIAKCSNSGVGKWHSSPLEPSWDRGGYGRDKKLILAVGTFLHLKYWRSTHLSFLIACLHNVRTSEHGPHMAP